MAKIETAGLLPELNLWVSWFAGPSRTLSEGTVQKGQLISWPRGLDVDLLDSMLIHTYVASGLLALNRKSFRYQVGLTAGDLSISGVKGSTISKKLARAEINGWRENTYMWRDADTGLVFNIR
ncbi:MAG: hypothetical protein WAV40_01865 [Microgenomates group bacterium]